MFSKIKELRRNLQSPHKKMFLNTLRLMSYCTHHLSCKRWGELTVHSVRQGCLCSRTVRGLEALFDFTEEAECTWPLKVLQQCCTWELFQARFPEKVQRYKNSNSMLLIWVWGEYITWQTWAGGVLECSNLFFSVSECDWISQLYLSSIFSILNY